MAKAIETLSIRLEFKDAGAQQVVDKIKGSFRGLQQVISGNTTPAMRQLRNEINTFAVKGNKSISTIEGQVTALRALRREADINSKEFKELTADIGRYEKQLNKAQGRRGGGGARQATQVAGAVISGGIFGGPEGAVGGALGAATGGVQGAFAGAAIGAQVGGLRRSIGDAADYAAQIGKLKIALEGVSPNQDAFNSALETAAEATRELNVPQDAAVRGITRLTAAVTGAGGPIGDAETTFKNVTAAIKATGGSTEDVKGAITAMVQVFSKGKVSAEELSGQLGERLPGAVTMFAKANKMTLPELQKNLKAGTVGLNELMKFIEELGVEFEGTAKKIAGSNEEAGARLSVAFKEMQAEVGNSLIETGANFQDAFAEFIKNITPGVVKGIELIKKAVSGFMVVFLPAAAGITTFVLLLKSAAIVTSLGGIGLAIGALALKLKVLAAGIATLGIVMATNPLFLGIAAVGGIVAGIVAITQAINGQAKATERLIKAGKSDTATADEKQISLSTLTSQKATQLRIIRENKDRPTTGQGSAATARKLRNARAELKIINKDISIVTRVKEKPEKEDPFDYGTPTTESDGSGSGSGKTRKGPKDISSLQREAQLASIIAGRNKSTVEQRRKALNLQRQAAVRASEELEPNKQLVELLKISETFRKGALKIETDILEKDKERVKAAVALNAARAQLQVQLGLTTKQEQVKAAQDSFKQEHPGATDQDLDLIRQTIDPTLFEQGTAQIRKMREELAELLNPINQVTGAANAIGTAFTDSFKSVIDGSATTQEALAGFFKNIANYFLDMAMQIIQKMITMYILNTVVGLLPGGSLGSVNAGAGTSNLFGNKIGNFGGGTPLFAKGGVFAKNKIVPYAKGGIVDKPTMFAYANGGAGRFGLMGEAGPEAILPLQRGPGGKLGVQASGGGGVSVGNINITVENTGEQLTPAAQKQLAGQVQGIVLSTLANERRSGGML